MKAFMTRRKSFFVAATAAIALSLSACGGGTGAPTATPAEEAPYKVAENVTLSGSPTFDKIKADGKVRIGVKNDQPLLGFMDAATGQYSGFDIEIAQWIAASLGVSKDKIEFKSIPSGNRESAITNGDIDYYVGTYSITDKRKTQIDFAGPYFITGQGLLVKKDNSTIKSEKDLAGKTVCSATGSTSIQNIRDNFPNTKTTEFESYSLCVQDLMDGGTDAITTDQAILLGYVAQDPDNLKVAGEPFTVEKYGVGLKKGDTVLRQHINKMFTDGGAVWQKIYDQSLGKSGTKVEQPVVDNY